MLSRLEQNNELKLDYSYNMFVNHISSAKKILNLTTINKVNEINDKPNQKKI